MSPTGNQLRGLDIEASEAERSRAEWVVQEAYADGRLEQGEFETRIGITLTAVSRRDLNDAVRGLRSVTEPSLSEAALRPTGMLPRPTDAAREERNRSAVAHLSGLALLGIGPLIAYAVSPPDSYERREAAKAFNFQVATAGVAVAAVLPWRSIWAFTSDDSYLSPLFLLLIAGLALNWVMGTVAGAAAAFVGKDMKHPLLRVVRFELLREGPPTTSADQPSDDDQILPTPRSGRRKR